MKKAASFMFIVIFAIGVMAKMSALDIMKRVDTRSTGDKISSDMSLVLIDKYNKQRIRKVKRFFMKKGADDRIIMFFVSPADVKNTSFLTYDYSDDKKSDDQWMYTPSDKKIRRIASSDKSGSFMGTDMNYSDMISPDLSDFTYTLLKETVVNGNKTWMIKSVPNTPEVISETGYKKSVIWVRQDNFVVIRAMKYVDKGGDIKYMTVKKCEKIDGIWVNLEIEMKTMKSKVFQHKTIINFSNVKFNNDFDEAFFTQPRMRKGL